jgi:hypothetical protein
MPDDSDPTSSGPDSPDSGGTPAGGSPPGQVAATGGAGGPSGSLPPQGAPVSQSVPAAGRNAAALNRVQVAIKLMESALPMLEHGTDEKKVLMAALNKLSHHFGQPDPRLPDPMEGIMRARMQAQGGAPGAGGASPGGMPGAPGGVPTPNRGPIPAMRAG